MLVKRGKVGELRTYAFIRSRERRRKKSVVFERKKSERSERGAKRSDVARRSRSGRHRRDLRRSGGAARGRRRMPSRGKRLGGWRRSRNAKKPRITVRLLSLSRGPHSATHDLKSFTFAPTLTLSVTCH